MGLAEPIPSDDWMDQATTLGWDESRLESIADILSRSHGHVLRVTANVIAMRCPSGALQTTFRELNRGCWRAGSLEIQDLSTYEPPK